jgi:PAS domain S-box-containing protein
MEKLHFQVLLVEDNPADVLFLREALAQDALATFELAQVESLGEALQRLAEQAFDAAMLDLGLPDSQGLPTFQKIHQSAPELPVVVLSALNDEDSAMQAMQAGAQDYLVKRPQEFPFAGRALRYAIERQRSGAALRASEANSRNIIEKSTSAFAILDRDGKILYSNARGIQIWKDPQVVGKTVFDILPPEPAESHLQAIRRVIDTHTDARGEIEIPVADQMLWFEFTLTPIKNPDGTISSALWNAWDLTDRKQAEAELRDSENRFSKFFHSSPTGIILTRMEDGRVVNVNDAFLKIFGYERQQVIGRTTLDLHIYPDPDDRARLITRLREQGKISGEETNFKRSSGEIGTAYFSAEILDFDGKQHLLSMMVDITERKRAEDQLRRSEVRAQATLSALPNMIFRLDRQGVFLDYKAAIQDLYVQSLPTLVGRRNRDVTPAEFADLIARQIEATLASGQLQTFEYQLDVPGVGPQDFEARMAPSGADEVVAIVRNTTEAKRLHELLEQSEASFKRLFEQNAVPMWVYDPDTLAFLAVNDAAIIHYGYSRQEFLRMTIRDIRPAEDLEKLHESVQQRATAYQMSGPWRHLKKDGTLILVAIGSHTTTWQERPAVIVVAFDQTAQIQAEQQLSASELRFRELAENIQEVFWVYEHAEQRISYISPGYELIWGKTVESLYADPRSYIASIYPEDRPVMLDALERQAGGASSAMEYRIVRPDGTIRWIWDRSVPIHEAGKLVRTIGVASDITERKQVEEQVRVKDRLLQMTSTMANVGGWEFDALTQQGTWTEEVARIHGLPPSRDSNVALGLSFYVGESRLAIEKAVGEAVTEGKPYDLTLELVDAAGVKKWVRTMGLPVLEHGRVVKVQGIFQDVTERRQREIALKAGEEKYRGLVESLESALASIDSEGTILYLNDVAARRLGDNAENLTGKTMYDLFPAEYARQEMETIHQVIRQNHALALEAQNSVQGIPRWFRIAYQPIHDEQGNVTQVLINATDIHELKSAQQELAELNRTLEERIRQATAEIQDLYDNAPIGYHSLDASGCIVMINQTELNWLGYTREELVGQPYAPLFTPASLAVFQDVFPFFQQRGWIRDVEIEVIRKDGSTFPVLVNATAVRDAAGSYLMSRTVIFDNTERKRAEKALRESEAQLRTNRDKLSAANAALEKAARMKDEFLASMSHELRTPLTGILGLSEALQLNTYGIMNEKQTKAIKNIEESGRHLLALINDILDLSKIGAGMLDLEIEPVSLAEVCQASLHLTRGLAQKKQLSVGFVMDTEAIQVRGDSRRLKQMLVNLLSNAIKFTPAKGSIGLEVQADEVEQVVRCTVWDKGIGIAPENLDRLFQPFVQLESHLARQYEGTGLGLSLVQRMAELHGGCVQVESTLGVGSRFTILLPWTPGGTQPAPLSERSAQALKRALIVEDLEIDAGQLARYLHILGMETTLHTVGRGAAERAAREQPDVILLDLYLPDRSGFDVLAELKTRLATRDIPVVICSVEERRSQAVELGAAGYLVKPLALTELRDELDRLASNREHRSAVPAAQEDADSPRVLIVDDNETIIESLCDFLEGQAFQVRAARSGLEMLEIIPDLHPDIVLMDIQMPVMDGIEATRRVRAHPDPAVARVPIIALTALAMTGDRERCLAAGANEYMSKPVGLLQLLDTIRALLRQNS